MYNYRTNEFSDKGFPESRQIGWIAQEVEKVAPELVTKDKNGYLYLSYSHSSPLIAAAVVELSNQVDVLKSTSHEGPDCQCTAVIQRLETAVEEIEASKMEIERLKHELEVMKQNMANFNTILQKLMA